ncbi:hypothetical protein DAEQUDRAFT_21889 [Daedalea quercina L-15889]|uniref:Uncharacterized protein n=1 Tax=Daedalea quercina L-15889 TaxID=1314783 RepID=A0A165ULW9_9APHY|nr:hypothetical protein DAEQUDRAFT_21889 [Daedalea quercina L-15889]
MALHRQRYAKTLTISTPSRRVNAVPTLPGESSEMAEQNISTKRSWKARPSILTIGKTASKGSRDLCRKSSFRASFAVCVILGACGGPMVLRTYTSRGLY